MCDGHNIPCFILTLQHSLLLALDDFAGGVEITAGQTTVTFSRDNFAISAEEVDSSTFEGITFSTNSRRNFRDGQVGTSSGTSAPSDSVASIVLPLSLLEDSSSGSQRFGFSVFEDDTLFQPRSTPEEFRELEVGSVFISATLYGSTVSGLTDEVTVRLQKSTVCLLTFSQQITLCISLAAKFTFSLCILGSSSRW